MKQHDVVIDLLTNPELNIKNVLNIGYRSDSNRSIQQALENQNIKFSVMDAYKPNCDYMRQQKVTEEIICMDCKNIDQLNNSYDAIIWLHGPEHVFWKDFLEIRKKIESKAKKIVIYQGPIGNYPQGAIYNNPYEVHKESLDPKKFKELSYTISYQNTKPERSFTAHKIIKKNNLNNLFKIHTNKSKLFGLIGLPRTGTTILNTFFNSIQNTFSFSEPIWVKIKQQNNFSYGKIKGKVNFKDKNDILPQLKKLLCFDEFLLGGIKETYRDFESTPVDILINSQLINFYIFIFRNPVCAFSGWKKRAFDKNYLNFDVFERNYKSMFNLMKQIIKNNTKPVYVIKYELFCNSVDNIKNYFNDKFLSEFQIIGNSYKLQTTGFTYGDPAGNNAAQIQKARQKVYNLSLQETILCEKLQPLYDMLNEGRQQ